MYITTNFYFSSAKAISMARWNVAPAFINPNGIFVYMKAPQGVVKVVFLGLQVTPSPSCTQKTHPSWISFLSLPPAAGSGPFWAKGNYLSKRPSSNS